nr:hypothetical protein [Tanacetum cinerariifolium]
MKLRAKRILNGGVLSRRMIGNRAGVIELLYAGLESGMVVVRDVDDVFNSVAAGLGTGRCLRPRVKLDMSVLKDIKDGMDFCLKHAREESVLFLPGNEITRSDGK